PTRTPTGTITPLPPTFTATPTEVPPPTRTPTPSATATPIVPSTATPTATPLPPGTRYLYAPVTVERFAARDCQSIENEALYPNDDVPMAETSPPICADEPFTGWHNIASDQTDLYRLIVTGTQNVPLTVHLAVPDINLSLGLYDFNIAEVAYS